MSFIAPNTTVKFIKNCPLEKSYQHTLWWNTITAQTNYFNSIVKTPTSKFTLNDLSYQRSNKGKLKVELAMEDLIDCNYMMFNNASFENKWFYAFITKVDYISNDVCEVSYQLDVIQSWFFDFTMKQSFVEREHSVTDVSGENLQPENINVGNYVDNGGNIIMIDGADITNSPKYLLITSFDQDSRTKFTGKTYDGIFSALDFRLYTANSLVTYLSNLETYDASLFDEIISLTLIPNDFNFSDTNILNKLQTQIRYIEKFNEDYTGSYGTGSHATLDGYSPRNNKLYTYPYNFIRFTNDIDSLDLAYELFTDLRGKTTTYPNSFRYEIMNILFPQPTLILNVYSYQKIEDRFRAVLGPQFVNNRLEINDFPQCAVSADIYKIYLGQLTSSLPVKLIGSSTEAVGNLTRDFKATDSNSFLGRITEGIAGAVTGIADFTKVATPIIYDWISSILEKPSPLPERTAQVKGTQTAIADYDAGFKHFAWHYMSIRREQAERIDSYFDRFGYATNKTKVPNRNSRPHWNYVKTAGCLIDGAMPADDEELICKIHDNGITYWHDPDEVGDYSLDNRPN